MDLSKNLTINVLALCATTKITINVLALCAVNQKVSETIQKHDNVQECHKFELHFHASSVILFIVIHKIYLKNITVWLILLKVQRVKPQEMQKQVKTHHFN